MDTRTNKEKILYIFTVAKRSSIMGLFSMVLLLACIHCAEEKKETTVALKEKPSIAQNPPVAQVGDKTISLEQFRAFSRKIPEYLQSKKKGIERDKNHLQTMIDRKILLLEAVVQGVDRSPDFLKDMRHAKENKIFNIFQMREIKVDITQQEILDFFESEGLSKMVRFDEILVESRDKALAVIAELRAGARFEEVAEKWSVDAETTTGEEYYNHSGKYMTQLNAPPRIGEVLFSMEVGEVSDPLMLVDGHYAIFRLTDVEKISLNRKLMPKIYRKLYVNKFGREKAALVQKIRAEYGLELHRKGLSDFLKKIDNRSSFDREEERSITLYTYSGGKISAEDFIDAASAVEKELVEFADSAQVVAFADSAIVPDAMIIAAAFRAEIDREGEVVEWLAEHRERLLMIELRASVLEGELELSTEEIQQYYDTHRDDFMNPELLEVQEVLVGTEKEALALVEQVRGGASLGELARTHSVRPIDQRDEAGKMHFHDFEKNRFGGLVKAAQEVPIGQLTGPVEVKGGYSIFEVLTKKREQQIFAQAKKRVRATILWLRKQKIFEQYLQGLQKKYASQVNIWEDNLKLASEAG